MRILKKKGIISKNAISLDIETVRDKQTFGELSEDQRMAVRFKFKDKGIVRDDREVAQLYIENAAFYAEMSRVVSVGLVFLAKDGEKLICQSFTSANELELLTNLSALLDRIYKANPSYFLCGHNLLGFDVPYLVKRYIYNRLPIPRLLDETDEKWNKKNIDTLDLLKVGHYGQGASLVAIAVAMGLEIPKDEMHGGEVAEHFFKGDLDIIDRYVVKDCITTYNVLAVMLLEKTYLFEEVLRIPTTVSSNTSDAQAEAEIPVMPSLNQLYLTKEFSEDIQEDIRDRFLNQGKKAMVKDFKMLEQMLCDLYVENAMFKADKVEVANAKKEEINEFVEQLKKDYKKSKK